MSKRKYEAPQTIYRSRKERNKKKKNKWPYIIILLLAFCLATVAGSIFVTSSLFDNEEPQTQSQKSDIIVAKNKTIVMLMGVDERDDDVGRSDTLMVAMLDPKKKKAALLSVPRDTRVRIPGYGYDKINSAFAYGGYKLTRTTVEDLLGVRMEHYILINVNAFTKIIDAIGGVDINVEKRMYYEDPWDDNGGLVIDLYPGEQHMDGDTAITYVRYRDEEGDIGRITRQQKFMQAVIDKLTSPAIITNIPTIIREVVSSVETDLSVRELLEFTYALKEAHNNTMQTEMVPGKPVYIDDISYWIPDVAKLRTTVANTLDVHMSNSYRSAMERDTYEYEESVPSYAQEAPVENRYGRYNDSDGEDDIRPDRTKGRYNTARPEREAVDDDEASDDDDNSSDSDRLYDDVIRPSDRIQTREPSEESEPVAPAPEFNRPSAGKTTSEDI